MEYKPPRDLFVSLLLVVLLGSGVVFVLGVGYGVVSIFGVGLLDYASAVFAIGFVGLMTWLMVRGLRNEIRR